MYVGTSYTPQHNNTSKYLFKIKTTKGQLLKILFDSLKDFVQECNILIDPSGLKIKTIDNSHVAIAKVTLHADKFEKFECEKKYDEKGNIIPHVIGIDLKNLNKLIKNINLEATMIIYILNKNQDKLCIKVENDLNRTDENELNLMDIDYEDFDIPDVKFDSVIEMSSSVFHKICRDMDNIDTEQSNSKIEIQSIGPETIFYCKTRTSTRKTSIMSPEDENTPKYPAGADIPIVKGTFSLKYLKIFCKSFNLSKHITLYLNNKTPLILELEVGGLGELIYLIAPQIDE